MSKCPIAPLFGRSGALVSTGLVRKREPPRRTLRPRVRRRGCSRQNITTPWKPSREDTTAPSTGFDRKRDFSVGERKVARRPVSVAKGIVRCRIKTGIAHGASIADTELYRCLVFSTFSHIPNLELVSRLFSSLLI